MTLEIFIALTIFAFVSSISPGPNNLMLMGSGANFGFKKTVPHLLGVALGFTAMIVLVGLGIMQIFDYYPSSYQVLKVLSVAYLLYLAFKLATASNAIEQGKSKSKPMTFMQAALFQWVNPKAWTMALTGVSVYAPSQTLSAVLFVALVFGLINLPCVSSWIVMGEKMQRLLTNHTRLKVFNYSMSALLVASLYPVIT